MTPRIKILENLFRRIEGIKTLSSGALYGIMYDMSLLVVGATFDTEDYEGIDSYLEMQVSFPTGIDFCGGITCNCSNSVLTEEETVKKLKEVFVTDNPVFIRKELENEIIKVFVFLNERLMETEISIVSEDEFLNTFVALRVQATLRLTCNFKEEYIMKGLGFLQRRISTGTSVFKFKRSDFYLYGDYCGMRGPSREETTQLGDLLSVLSVAKDVRMKMSVIEVSMLLYQSEEPAEDGFEAPLIINSPKECTRYLSMALPVDGICLAIKTRMAIDCYGLLVDTVCRSIRLFQNNILEIFDDPQQSALLQQYHFFPSSIGHFITLVRPLNLTDDKLREMRLDLHRTFMLPMNFPVFRKGNSLCLKTEFDKLFPLTNVHLGLRPSGVKNGTLRLVQGFYAYYHYLQDGFDDSGWGCAYRSLQTLFSWFRLQGYTDLEVPNHKDIQSCLVRLKDKPSQFINSTEWIGSTEVSYCLDDMLGISCRILDVASIKELPSRGSELIFHFEIHGSPIMIGGGSYAFTILGVDYDQENDNIKFLVLDPHYIGTDDVGIIQKKGMVAWRSTDFFCPKHFYNLCLPQRPQNV